MGFSYFIQMIISISTKQVVGCLFDMLLQLRHEDASCVSSNIDMTPLNYRCVDISTVPKDAVQSVAKKTVEVQGLAGLLWEEAQECRPQMSSSHQFHEVEAPGWQMQCHHGQPVYIRGAILQQVKYDWQSMHYTAGQLSLGVRLVHIGDIWWRVSSAKSLSLWQN
eukprot:scaffold317496_cov55-Attheya_sp.AAC.1